MKNPHEPATGNSTFFFTNTIKILSHHLTCNFDNFLFCFRTGTKTTCMSKMDHSRLQLGGHMTRKKITVTTHTLEEKMLCHKY